MQIICNGIAIIIATREFKNKKYRAPQKCSIDPESKLNKGSVNNTNVANEIIGIEKITTKWKK